MKTDLALLALTLLYYGFIAGNHSAIQLFSHVRSDKNGDDGKESAGVTERLEQDSIGSYFALGLGRVLALILVMFTSLRFAAEHVTGGLQSTLPAVLVMLACVFLPPAVANLVALGDPERFVRSTRPLVYPIIYLLRPLVRVVVTGLAHVSPRLLDALSFPVLTVQRRIEVAQYKSRQREGDERSLVSSVFAFGATRVREVMVPRIDMVAVNIHSNPTDAIAVIVEAGHSRIPLFDESIDRIVGVIHTKDLLKKLVSEEEFSLSSLRRDAHFVPESKMIDELLAEFKELKIHLAVVVDEYGGTAGLVTLEDVLEELVGDIQDEFDSEEELIKRMSEDVALCDARVRLDELNETLGLDLPAGDADSLGGFLYAIFGRVPSVGERLERGPVEFKIQSVLRQRIDKVLIRGLGSIGKRTEGAA